MANALTSALDGLSGPPPGATLAREATMSSGESNRRGRQKLVKLPLFFSELERVHPLTCGFFTGPEPGRRVRSGRRPARTRRLARSRRCWRPGVLSPWRHGESGALPRGWSRGRAATTGGDHPGGRQDPTVHAARRPRRAGRAGPGRHGGGLRSGGDPGHVMSRVYTRALAGHATESAQR